MDEKFQEYQENLFKGYPDVVCVKEMCEMLGNISTKTAYELLKGKMIQHFRIGHKYMIPKCCIISYIYEQNTLHA